jgi:DNA-directed RNA polymerase I subunit RPA49
MYSLQDERWRSLIEQRDDPSAYQDLDLGESKTTSDVTDSQASMNVRNIPPYNAAADTSEKAYLFDEIIPKNIRAHLLDIVGHYESGEFASKGYGTFVSNRVNKLHELQVHSDDFLKAFSCYLVLVRFHFVSTHIQLLQTSNFILD